MVINLQNHLELILFVHINEYLVYDYYIHHISLMLHLEYIIHKGLSNRKDVEVLFLDADLEQSRDDQADGSFQDIGIEPSPSNHRGVEQ